MMNSALLSEEQLPFLDFTSEKTHLRCTQLSQEVLFVFFLCLNLDLKEDKTKVLRDVKL